MQQCVRIESHQQWLAWFTVGNRLSNGVVLKIFEAVDMATLSRCCVGSKFKASGFSSMWPRGLEGQDNMGMHVKKSLFCGCEGEKSGEMRNDLMQQRPLALLCFSRFSEG